MGRRCSAAWLIGLPLVSVEDGVRTGPVGLLPDERLHASAGAGGGVVDGCRGTGSLVVGNNVVDGVQLSRGTSTGDAATGAGGLERGSVSRGIAGLGGGAGSRGGLGGRGRTGTLSPLAPQAVREMALIAARAVILAKRFTAHPSSSDVLGPPLRSLVQG